MSKNRLVIKQCPHVGARKDKIEQTIDGVEFTTYCCDSAIDKGGLY